MTNVDLTPTTAQQLLDTAYTAEKKTDSVIQRAWISSAASIFIGLLMGAFLLASVYALPNGSGLQALLISAGYVAGIIIATTTYNLGRTLTRIGWVQQYQKGLAISCGVFFVALAASFITDQRSLWLWMPLAVITVLPVSYFGAKKVVR
jgi:hypothetical protein